MLARSSLARPVVAAAVLLTAGAGSVLVTGGTSAADGPAVAGPVAAVGPRVVVGPVVPSSLMQLPPLPAGPPGPPLGPATGSPPVGPPGVVGPDSPPPQVRAVQRLLNRAGARLRVDGAWGPATTRAVSAAQARAGLPVDGRAGAMTVAFLAAQPGRP